MIIQLSVMKQQRLIPRKYDNQLLYSLCVFTGQVYVGTRLSVSFSVSTTTVTSDTCDSTSPKCTLMKEKIGSRVTKVSFRTFLPASLAVSEHYPPACLPTQ